VNLLSKKNVVVSLWKKNRHRQKSHGLMIKAKSLKQVFCCLRVNY